MKTSEQAYPYPVINDDPSPDADYVDAAFQCSFEGLSLQAASESSDQNKLIIPYKFMLSNDEIENLIDEGKAAFAIHVYCADTLERRMYFPAEMMVESEREIGSPGSGALLEGAFEIVADELYGKVEFDPLIVVKENVQDFFSSDLNEEFEGVKFELQPGDIIGMAEGIQKYIDYNKLEFETLIKARKTPDLEKFEYTIQLTESVIFIWMGEKIYSVWEGLRSDKKTRPTVAMSIYKDCFLIALADLAKQESSEEQAWARALKRKLNGLGIELREELDVGELNQIAQKIVKSFGVETFYSSMSDGEQA